jgi:GT2 family glycosyltransferase
MISIITAIYNQLAVNRLFLDSLRRYTHHPYELIIVDNGSTDGSADFFADNGATVIRNGGNYSYPHCQNQGIKAAQYDHLAFLNNDIIVSPDWDRHLIDSMLHNQLEVITSCGIEQIETHAATRQLRRRWQRIKSLIGLLGVSSTTLRWMHQWMYKGKWEKFSRRRYDTYRLQVTEGFVGNSVLMHRSAIDKIGLWDERIQGADFDLYLRSKERSLLQGDMKPVHIALDTFVHHYIRLTMKAGYPPFRDASNLISVEQKWSPEQRAFLANLHN